MNIGFERILPTPGYPTGTTAAALLGLRWTSKANVVTLFKGGLKVSLRTAQLGRCCFCRRLLYDDYASHLEHFVDKDGYGDYTFEIRNLALACGTCNIKKNGSFSSFAAKLRERANKHGTPVVAPCPVLAVQLNGGVPYPTAPGAFRWVNPHVHNYSDHIEICRSWVFRGKTREGARTIRGVRLNEVGDVEKRALFERLEARGGKLSMLVGAISELNQHRARTVGSAVAAALRRRRQSATAAGA